MLEFFFIHRLSQEERSAFCAVIRSVILSKNMYKYMCFISKVFHYWAIWLHSSLALAPDIVLPSVLWSIWIGVKRQLAVVKADSDTARVLWKMTHIFTNAEYSDMMYFYGFSHGSAVAALEEYRRLFLMCRIPDRRLFSKMFSILRASGCGKCVWLNPDFA